MENKNFSRICPLALGVSGGILWALAVFAFAGACIGAVWGFFDASIGLALLALIYNFIIGKMAKCHLIGKCKK